MILGTVSAVNSDGITLIIDGETTPTSKRYSFLKGYYPVSGDRVLIEDVGDQYVIIGTLVTDRQLSSARYIKDIQTGSDLNICFAWFSNAFWIGKEPISGGGITWAKITTT